MRQGDGKRLGLGVFHAAQKAEQHLESLIREDLRQSSYDEVGRVTCVVNEGLLTLSGRVSSYYLKQIAQGIALNRIDGAATVVNELRVEP